MDALREVKFSVLADLHHYPGVFHTEALRRLEQIRQRAVAGKVDCVISLGDFCHNVNRFPEIVRAAEAFEMPFYHVMGNHETDNAALDDVVRAYRMPGEYYFFDVKGFRFVALDTNYYRHPGGHTHFEFRNYFDFPDTREELPDEQLAWLRDAVMTAPGPCILLSHAGIERPIGGVKNREKVLDIIREANSTGHRVLMAINGHHHRDHLSIDESVAWFDLNSASFDWLNTPHRLFPEELHREYELVDHMVIYNEPLHAVVTVREDGEIHIQGMKGGFFRGVTREMTDNSRGDRDGRVCRAEVLSADFKLLPPVR